MKKVLLAMGIVFLFLGTSVVSVGAVEQKAINGDDSVTYYSPYLFGNIELKSVTWGSVEEKGKWFTYHDLIIEGTIKGEFSVYKNWIIFLIFATGRNTQFEGDVTLTIGKADSYGPIPQTEELNSGLYNLKLFAPRNGMGGKFYDVTVSGTIVND